MPRSLVIALLALAAAGSGASCSGARDSDSLTQPTPASADSLVSLSAPPTAAVHTTFSFVPDCPTNAPFTAPIDLVVRVNGDVRVFVTEIRMQFTDPFRIVMPQVTLPAPQLIRQFGSNLVDARSGRTFPLNVGFGCGTDRTGTVVIVVDTRDERGRSQSGQISVAVR